MLIIFFDSQGIVHKEIIPQGKRVNAEFYKGVMDRLLKRIEWVRPAAFCSRDFFLLHDNLPAHKAASICQFFTPKNIITLYHSPILSRLISTRLFSVPQVKKEVKRTPLCRCCWDPRSRNWWIKEGPKRGIFNSFSETVQMCKSLYLCQWSLFWIKKKRYVCLIFKKISPKTFGQHFVVFAFFNTYIFRASVPE